MQKVIYARVPDHVHDYIMRQAAASGLSMGAYIRQLIAGIMRNDQPAFEHSAAGICTLAPDRPNADVGICRACLEQGLFDATQTPSPD